MNPLLFANLGSQRRLLESGSAYSTERLVINIVAVAVAVGCVVAMAVVFKITGEPPYPMPEDFVVFIRIEIVVAGMVALGVSYLSWAFMRAFLDMADASIAISLGASEQQPASPVPAPRPRGGGASWPEPPKPLNPFAEEARPEDLKYMPGGT